MVKWTGRLVALLAVAAIGATVALKAPRPADAAGDSVAVAVATQDGKTTWRVKLSIRRDNGDIVDTSNAAVAYASCADCSATAISFQVLLVQNDASVVTPQNLALALTESCDGCASVAEAYQFVHGTDGQVHFTADGSQTLAHARRELQSLRHGDLTIPELQDRLDALQATIADVLAHELVHAGSS